MIDYPQLIVPVGHSEPVPRRIRAFKGATLAIDTTRASYVWERPHYPRYYIPISDVSSDFLGLADTGVDSSGLEPAGTRHFPWNAFDHWFEEDEEVFIHPRSPYTRVDALRSSRSVRIELDGVVLGESASSVMVFETGLATRYYLDKTAVRLDLLTETDTVTGCPYKGTTSRYWAVPGGEQPLVDVAWCYDFPTRQLLAIAGLIAFYNEKVDVFVDGIRISRPLTPFSEPVSQV